MKMTMEYLQWGKDGCDKCAARDYYCEDCTAAILEHVNAESRPTPTEADSATPSAYCVTCGGPEYHYEYCGHYEPAERA